MTEHAREMRLKGWDVMVAGLVAGLMTLAFIPLEIRASHDADTFIHWPGFWLICSAIGIVLAARDFTRKWNGLRAAAVNALFETVLVTIFAILPLVTRTLF